MLSETVQIALVATIAPTVAALAGVFISLGNRRKAEETRVAVTATAAKADTIIEKAAEIHTLTNSNLSKVTAALEVANEKIQGLEKLMASMVKAHAAANAAKP